MLLKAAVEKFVIALEAQGRQKRTFGTYEERLKYLQQFAEAKELHKLEDITLEDMDLWAVSMYRRTQRWTNHRTRSPVSGGLSDVTIAECIQAVETIFEWRS